MSETTPEKKNFTVSTEYALEGDTVTVYLRVAERSDAVAYLGDKKTGAVSNLREPFDFRMHIFRFGLEELTEAGGFGVTFTRRVKTRPSEFFTEECDALTEYVPFAPDMLIDAGVSDRRADRGLVLSAETGCGSIGGLEWKTELYLAPDGAKVRVCTMIADPERVGVMCGTPHAAPVFVPKDIETVMDEALSAEKLGLRVLGATNGDFFDMFGDCSPSGLCVSQGVTVANPDSPNPFFGITREGNAVIGFTGDYPPDTLAEAIGGGQIIVRDGKPADTAPFQPFGEKTHPRTAFGIARDGRIIATVVDGRRPDWSNGAALIELAQIMINNGAVIALNTDGGGSSTFIVRINDELRMLNHPADLYRPMEDLIRPLFDSLIFYEK